MCTWTTCQEPHEQPRRLVARLGERGDLGGTWGYLEMCEAKRDRTVLLCTPLPRAPVIMHSCRDDLTSTIRTGVLETTYVQVYQRVTATGLFPLAEAGCHEQSIIEDEKSKCSCLMCRHYIPKSKVGPEGIQSGHHLESNHASAYGSRCYLQRTMPVTWSWMKDKVKG